MKRVLLMSAAVLCCSAAMAQWVTDPELNTQIIAGVQEVYSDEMDVAEDGTVQGVSYGTPMGWTQDFYRTIPIQPTAYGQGLTFLMLTEKLG